jgi:hypothetical protein
MKILLSPRRSIVELVMRYYKLGLFFMQFGPSFIAGGGVSVNHHTVPYKYKILITRWGPPRFVP